MDTLLKLVLLATAVLAMSAGSAAADTDAWSVKQLFTPNERQLEMERRGRINIYDGFRDVDIERVLDEQFNRVQSMMFTGTVVTDDKGEPARDRETGEILVENDGC